MNYDGSDADARSKWSPHICGQLLELLLKQIFVTDII